MSDRRIAPQAKTYSPASKSKTTGNNDFNRPKDTVDKRRVGGVSEEGLKRETKEERRRGVIISSSRAWIPTRPLSPPASNDQANANQAVAATAAIKPANKEKRNERTPHRRDC